MDMKISIIIRAFNEEKHIDKLLRGIRSQKTNFSNETILVDSGSTDRTGQIAREYGVRVVQISPQAFSFGYSLNTGIERAKGEFCIFISAHCFPRHELWLERMIAPFVDDEIALVYGKQRGDRNNKFTENQIFLKWFPDSGDGKQDSPFCNNANTAIRKALWRKWKYDETITGLEDIEWAKRVISQGYSVYYASSACVIHSHDETFSQIFRRFQREGIAMKSIYPGASFNLVDFLKMLSLDVIADFFRSIKEGVFFKNMISIPIVRLIQFWGTYRGYKLNETMSSDLKRKLYYPKKFNISNAMKKNNTVNTEEVENIIHEL